MMSAAPPKPRPHWIAGACSAAFFMEFLDATGVNVAMPEFGRQFAAGPDTTHWIATVYVLALASCVLTSGWAQDRFGAKRVFAAAVLLFTAASIGCAAASSLSSLVSMRVIQGMAGGMMSPVGFALVLRAYPPDERARVASYMLVPSFLAMVVGPTLGGMLLEWATWHWIFLINGPLGLLTWAIISWAVPTDAPSEAGAFHWTGFITSSLGLVGVFGAVLLVGEEGHLSAGAATALGIGGICMVLFVGSQRGHPSPLLDLRIFNDRVYAAGAAVQLLAVGLVTGTLFLFTLCQQQALHRSPLTAGMLCAVQALTYALCVPLASALARRFDDTYLIVAGVAAIGVSTLLLCRAPVQEHYVWLVPTLVLRGVGSALCLPTSWTKAFKYVKPEQVSGASAAMSATIQLANAVGLASAALALRFATLAAPEQPMLPYQLALGALMFLAVGALIAALLQRPHADSPQGACVGA